MSQKEGVVEAKVKGRKRRRSESQIALPNPNSHRRLSPTSPSPSVALSSSSSSLLAICSSSSSSSSSFSSSSSSMSSYPISSSTSPLSPQCANVSLTDDLVASALCPVCMCFMLPPVWSCVNGHSICDGCLQKMTECPVCREDLQSKVRNLFAEQLLEGPEDKRHLYTCSYVDMGCRVRVPYTHKRGHEGTCPYREFECHRCRKFTGPASLLHTHFVAAHSLIVRKVEGKTATFTPKNNQRPDAGHWWCMYACPPHHYMLHITPAANGQFLNIQLYTFSPASTATVTLSVRSASGVPAYSYRSVPKSYHCIGSAEADDGLFLPVAVFYWLCDGLTSEARLAKGPPYLGASVLLEFDRTNETEK